MVVHELIKMLLEENQNQEVFFIDEDGKTKIYNITKIGSIDGIPATILGSGECPKCKGENPWQN